MSDELKRQLDLLNNNVGRLSETLRGHRKKDGWDVFGIISTFLSGVVIAGLIGWWTYEYHARQTKLEEKKHADYRQFEEIRQQYKQEIDKRKLELNILRNQIDEEEKAYRNRVFELQALEKFIPHLTADEENKKVALIAITTLGHEEIARKLGELYPSEGTNKAIDSIDARAIPANQSEIPIPTTAMAESSDNSVTGWVYLGRYTSNRWKTRYMQFKETAVPSKLVDKILSVRQQTGALNVRSGPPSLFGRLQNVTDVLKAGSKVRVLEIDSTPLTGGVWAKVEYTKT